MNRRIQALMYLLFDLVGSAIAWLVFHYFRKEFVERQIFGGQTKFELDDRIIIGLIVLPLFWVGLFFVNGFYKDVYRRSRLKSLGSSIWVTFFGVLVIFFLLLLDDYVASYRNYYQLFLVLFILQFTFTYFPRLALITSTIRRIRKKAIWFPTLIIGEGPKALQLFTEIDTQKKPLGNKIIGYLIVGGKTLDVLKGKVNLLGDLKSLKSVVKDHNIEEVLLAIEPSDNRLMNKVVNDLLGLNVIVKAIPSMYDYLTGRVKISSILGTPLIQLSFDLMPMWQQKMKSFLDFSLSCIALIALSPLIITVALIVKLTSKGPIFYVQERVGRYGKPFLIYKFRSMYVDAEANGPTLSSKEDRRITPIGKFIRKTRIDEVPNFWNVIKGEMSLVGPRPERQYYINQIIKKAPHYVHLQKVKPGITSWGQVRYGYAENVDQMIERLKYDLLYIENMSLYVDFKIMIYTLIIVFKGRGV